jgi:hypothetical protein
MRSSKPAAGWAISAMGGSLPARTSVRQLVAGLNARGDAPIRRSMETLFICLATLWLGGGTLSIALCAAAARGDLTVIETPRG